MLLDRGHAGEAGVFLSARYERTGNRVVVAAPKAPSA